MAPGQSAPAARAGAVDVLRRTSSPPHNFEPASVSLHVFGLSPRSAKERLMKLYYHPVSTTSRPVWLFVVENGIDCELQVVDLMKGEHHQPPYVSKNPNRLVPMLEDGDFRLTESSAILKYLAEKIGSP